MRWHRAARPAPSQQSRAVARGVSCDGACRCSSSNIGSNPLSPSSPYPWSSSGGGRAAPASAVQERPQPQRHPEALRGRVVIVTGGATGLGRAVALEFALGGCGVAFNCIHAAAPHIRAQRFCKIVNVASHQAFRPGFGIANYAASKAALIGLTKAAAVDLGSAGINVNAVAPGFVKTELLTQLPREVLERAEHESVLGRVAEPEDVSRVILFLCSEAARHITGQVIVVDGGLTLA